MLEDVDLDLTPFARYRFGAEIVDKLPHLTFLVGADNETACPSVAMRIVLVRRDRKYGKSYLTPGGRLLYHFWSGRSTEGESMARRRLGMATTGHSWAWIVKPGEPGFDLLDAFKIACDHRVDKVVPKDLLLAAIDQRKAR